MRALWWQGLGLSLGLHLLLAVALSGKLVESQRSVTPSTLQVSLVSPEAATPEPQKAGVVEAETVTKPKGTEPEPAVDQQSGQGGSQAVPSSPPEQDPAPPEAVVETSEATSIAVKRPKSSSPKEVVAQPEPEEAKATQSKEAKASPPADTAPETATPVTPQSTPKQVAPDTEATTEAQPEQASEVALNEGFEERIRQLAASEGGKQASQRLQEARTQFAAAVRKRIEREWRLPPFLEGQADLSVRIRVSLGPQGELAAKPTVVAVNGPGYLANSVIRAVKRAAPFPMPPGPSAYFQELELLFTPDRLQ